jgi:oligopeptide transport system ATP-binding protein
MSERDVSTTSAGKAASATLRVLLDIQNLRAYFPVSRGQLIKQQIGQVKAVDGVSLSIKKGEVMGLVGESGCGKSTLARCILKLQQPTDGRILFDGEDIWSMGRAATGRLRRRMQAVFQDPYSSLNPRMRVADIVGEPIWIHQRPASKELDRKVGELLDLCGLPRRLGDRFPHEMSGGQRQRVGIARALALSPDFVVCDEAVSALDVSIQAQIINLLEDLRAELGLTYLFIGHDLSVIRHLCDRVAVMYLGKLVEVGLSDELFERPKHPYTQALLEAVPIPDPEIESERAHQVLPGEVPSPLNPPAGCVFHPRCRLAIESCRLDTPRLQPIEDGHLVACPVVIS